MVFCRVTYRYPTHFPFSMKRSCPMVLSNGLVQRSCSMVLVNGLGQRPWSKVLVNGLVQWVAMTQLCLLFITLHIPQHKQSYNKANCTVNYRFPTHFPFSMITLFISCITYPRVLHGYMNHTYDEPPLTETFHTIPSH